MSEYTERDLLNAIALCDHNMEVMEQQRQKFLHEWANLACPLKAGEKTVYYSYGRRNGKPCVVTKIYAVPGWGEDGYSWEVAVAFLKKDGSASQNFGTFRQEDYTRIHEPQKTQEQMTDE